MQTIIVILDSHKMKNLDLDILYDFPEQVEMLTNEEVNDNGFDFLSRACLGIWLAAENAEKGAEQVIQIMKTEFFSENDLSQSAEVYISEKETAKLKDCRKVYPA